MHAVTWRSARAARRIPAQFIAGRRFPPRLRSFHRAARLHNSNAPPSEPRDPAAPAASEHGNEKDSQSPNGLRPAAENEQQDSSPEIAAEVAGESPTVIAEKLRKNRERTRVYQAALKRSSRNKQSEDFPPIHIPNRFLAQNVTIREDRASPRDSFQFDSFGYPPGRGPPKPEAGGNLSLSYVLPKASSESSTLLSQIRPEVEEKARLSLPLPQRLYELLEKTAAKKSKEAGRPRYEDILEYVNKVYSEDSAPTSDPEKAGANEASPKITSVDKSLHFVLYLEVLAAIAGSLNTAGPDLASSFPSAKSNLILHSPVEGGMTRLDRLVEDVAQDLCADLIKVDSQDIAELVGDYLGEGTDPNAFSLRSLGYDTHRSRSDGFELEEDEYDDFEAEEDTEEDPGTASFTTAPRTSGSSKGSKKHQPFIIQGVQALDAGDLFKMLGGAARGSAGRNASMGTAEFVSAPFGRDQSPETARWNEMKLGAYLDALLGSPSTKRANVQKWQVARGAEKNEEVRAPEDKKSEQSTSTEPLVIGQKGNWRLALDKADLETPQSPAEQQRTIILIKDYKELSVTRQGSRVLDKITELVHNRRKEGAEIMIVGTTSSAELVPEISRSAIRSLQAENEDSFFRTIVVPLGATSLKPSIDVLKSMATDNWKTFSRDVINDPADFVTAERRRNYQINARHVQDMVRRLDPSAKIAHSRPFYSPLGFPGIDWKSRVLAFHEVHRLVQTAIGLHRAASKSPKELSVDLIFLAGILIRISDDVKFSWAAQERQKDKEPKDSIPEASKAAPSKTPSDMKLEKVQKSANKHEKKLLAGVVNPSNIKTTFTDVHAPQETIDALKTMTSLSLLRPDAFSYGVLATDKIPGLLLYGPPGTGKTLLAKAVAKESGATVLEVSGSEVYDMYVGEGEKNVRAIFSLARKLSPCVVFIDEADAIFGSRSGSRHRTSHREVLNQFLKEWDGMNDLSVFIMVATNRPFDMDDAVLRRLPRRLLVDLPTQKDREQILRIHLKDEQLDSDVKLDELAAKTPFYSGSDLKNLCVAAALTCVREENEIAAAISAGQEAGSEEEAVTSTEEKSNEDSPATNTESSPDSAPAGKASPEEALGREFFVAHQPAAGDDSAATTPTPASPTSNSAKSSLYPAKRTLLPHHFEKAMQEISASISEDMASLTAIRKFDEQYGDKRGKRKKKSSWGFAVAEDVGPGEEAARVRPSSPSASPGL
ncbi:ATPase AAA+ type core [Botryosphaeria dothidea]|uniref:ATPase AAA+ type core n=1 Tax=Botryosphaeria dothidea TaxID=55169 RepID=A0A8H4J7P9_9PEZI|nr:ATPase AAA+ type core [Botryosphaeria dothidea]